MCFNEVVCAVSCFAVFAVHLGIREGCGVSTCFPNSAVHEYGSINTICVWIFLHKSFPPSALYIVLKFHTDRAIIPSVSHSTINFTSREDDASVFAEIDNFVHSCFDFFHFFSPFGAIKKRPLLLCNRGDLWSLFHPKFTSKRCLIWLSFRRQAFARELPIPSLHGYFMSK